MHHFEQIFFRNYLIKIICLEFCKISTKISTHFPIKENHVRCNQSSFMSKQLKKAIMTGFRLLNKYRKDKIAGNLFAFKRQRKICVKLLRKSKKDFHNNLNLKRITENRTFWQTITPNFTDKPLKAPYLEHCYSTYFPATYSSFSTT